MCTSLWLLSFFSVEPCCSSHFGDWICLSCFSRQPCSVCVWLWLCVRVWMGEGVGGRAVVKWRLSGRADLLQWPHATSSACACLPPTISAPLLPSLTMALLSNQSSNAKKQNWLFRWPIHQNITTGMNPNTTPTPTATGKEQCNKAALLFCPIVCTSCLYWCVLFVVVPCSKEREKLISP